MVRTEDERARALRDMGAEVVAGDLHLESMHRAMAGCKIMYFGMSVSDDYLAATVNVAAVVKHHGVKAFINMSQMTLAQMSIHETTASPQQKLHGVTFTRFVALRQPPRASWKFHERGGCGPISRGAQAGSAKVHAIFEVVQPHWIHMNCAYLPKIHLTVLWCGPTIEGH